MKILNLKSCESISGGNWAQHLKGNFDDETIVKAGTAFAVAGGGVGFIWGARQSFFGALSGALTGGLIGGMGFPFIILGTYHLISTIYDKLGIVDLHKVSQVHVTIL